MESIKEFLQEKIKPREKQMKLVKAVVQKQIQAKEFIDFFISASDVEKGICADAMKHISASHPDFLGPYIDMLLGYINHKLPRVRWGVQETIGNLSKDFPEQTADAIPFLLQNTNDNETNTTVIKWCAAYALTEIARNNPKTRALLIPVFDKISASEKNNGVKNVYVRAIKAIKKE